MRGKQESCEKHFSHCKTEVECQACNVKTLRSGANLFIKYPSVDYKWLSNMKHSHISASNAVLHASRTAKPFGKSFILFPCVFSCMVPHLHHKCGGGMYQFGLKMGQARFCGKNRTQRVNCLSDMLCVWVNA